jgi:hypothetical protein
MSTAFAGFLGALIGAGASLIGLLIQQYYQTKREWMKIATDIGLGEYKNDLELAKLSGPSLVAPLSAYVIYHARLLDEMSRGKINREKIMAIQKESIELFPKPKENDDEHKA